MKDIFYEVLSLNSYTRSYPRLSFLSTYEVLFWQQVCPTSCIYLWVKIWMRAVSLTELSYFLYFRTLSVVLLLARVLLNFETNSFIKNIFAGP